MLARYSILPALSLDGLLYSDVRAGSFDGDGFLEFLDGLLEFMNPYPAPRSVLILDNCLIHHIDGVQERCDAAGVKLLYLPPYSPDFNPIELFFSAFKAYTRRCGHEFRAVVEGGSKAHARMWVYEALDAVVTSRKAHGWFRECGYV